MYMHIYIMYQYICITYQYIHIYITRPGAHHIYIHIYIHIYARASPWPGAHPGTYIYIYTTRPGAHPGIHIYITRPGGHPRLYRYIYVCAYIHAHAPSDIYMCICITRPGSVAPDSPVEWGIYRVSWSKLHACMGRGARPRHGVR